MPEQFANAAESTLDGDIDDVVTTLTLLDASSCPASGAFRGLLALVDPVTGALSNQELLKVTAVAGNDLTIERAAEPYSGVQTPLAHADGERFFVVLSAGSLQESSVRFAGQPTLQDLLLAGSLTAVEGWRPNYDFGLAEATRLGNPGATDRVIYLHPTGDLNVFASQYGTTGPTIPDFASAPNPGDFVVEAVVGTVWYNIGPAATFPPLPIVWRPNYAFAPNLAPVLFWPPEPNGRLYAEFPNYGTTTGSTPPGFPTDGGYAGDGDGYVIDLGMASLPATPAPPASSFRTRVLRFKETAGAGVYTAALPVPAGTFVHQAWPVTLAPFDADTAALDMGDALNGSQSYYSALPIPPTAYNPTGPQRGVDFTDLKFASNDYFDATSFGSQAAVGGDTGLVSAPGIYYPADDTITAVLTTTGAGGTTGELLILIIYSVPPVTEAVKV